MKGKKKYVERLLDEARNTGKHETVTLQLSIEITEIEKKNLEMLVKKLKESGQKASIKTVCENAMRDSGIFDFID